MRRELPVHQGLFVATLAASVFEGLARGIAGRGHGLFAAFPPPPPGTAGSPWQPHAVFEAESIQLVGTVDANALQRKLLDSSDVSWKPLNIAGSEPDSVRALFSVGIGNFRNTTAGPYKEMAVAFPACLADGEPEPLKLRCRSFIDCQDQHPDCTHTYMFWSVANDESASIHLRNGGVDVKIASAFEYFVQPASTEKPGFVKFAVHDPSGEELIAGGVETSPPLPAGQESAEDNVEQSNAMFNIGRGPGYRLQPFVGPPVLGNAKSQSRHLCAFPGDLDAQPVRISGGIRAGNLFDELDFQLEGAFRFSRFTFVRLPPWGAEKDGPETCTQSTARAPMPKAQRPEKTENQENEVSARAPWNNCERKGSHENMADTSFPWILQTTSRVAEGVKMPLPPPANVGGLTPASRRPAVPDFPWEHVQAL